MRAACGSRSPGAIEQPGGSGSSMTSMYAPSTRMRVGGVEAPMAADRASPTALAARQDREAGDRSLGALGVAVQDLDGECLVPRNGVLRYRTPRVVRVADSPLPEARVPRRDVDVAQRDPEIIGSGVLLRCARPALPHVPAV